MPRWLPPVVAGIHDCAAQGRVRFTHKVLRELMELELSLDEADAVDVLAGLTAGDSAGRLRSKVTDEWLYIFKPDVGGTVIYIKVVLRANCVVVSFHEEGHDDESEDDWKDE